MVFGEDLQRNHLTALKEVLVAECDEFDEVAALKGVNFQGFKILQKILIRKLSMQICWSILRHFGYENTLHIKSELWDDGTISDFELNHARCFELKKQAIEFLCM